VDGFPSNDEFTDALRDVVIELDGMAYAGPKLDAYCALIRYLREHPDKAAFLLKDFDAP
jgi:hypothetical protein